MSAHPLSLYSVAIPPVVGMLTTLRSILAKAEAYVVNRNGNEAALLNDRLIFDQFPLVRQIQIASDTAKGLAGRISGVEIPRMEDTETTMQELFARIDATIAFLNTITPEQVNGKEEVLIPMPYQAGKALSASEYVTRYALPNFYFHAVTAYSIVRKNGVELGKSDYLANLPVVEMSA